MGKKECVVLTPREMPERSQNSFEKNQSVKRAMAEELKTLGLHPRSIERLLNIELDTRRARDFTKTAITEESHD
ncbi:MAG: hypothetical protein KKD44_25300 [Proteobacteria bacterium]|nr:hypothetical protein [Pseudomonadota bacterium]